MSDPRGVLLDRIISEINDLRRRVEAQEAQEQTPRAQKARALDTQFPDALLHLPFDGGVPYETDYSVNLYGHKLQRPTVASGGIIGRPGKFGKAVQIAEATTNLCPNPVMRTLWTANSGPTTLELSTDWKRFDQYSMHVVGSATWSGGRTLFAATAGATYTLSCYVKVVSGTAGLRIQQLVSPYTSYIQKSISGPYEGWVTVTGVVPNTETCMIVLGANGEAYFDGVQLEAKAYPTPFCYGDMGPGHAWTGTPHASTSTRVAARLGYGPQPGVDGPRGCYAFWFMPFANSGTWPTNTRLVQAGNGSSMPYCAVYCDDSGNTLRANRTGGGGGGCTAPIAWAAMEWHHIVFCWDNGTSRLFIDGVLASEQPCGVDIQTSDFYVGVWFNGTRQCNGYIDDLLILDRALTATEVKRLYEAGQAGLGVLCPPQWKVDDSGAADTHVIATDANGAATVVDLTTTGGLNVGTATGAGAGSISASGGLNVGTATGAGTGEIRASGQITSEGRFGLLDSGSTADLTFTFPVTAGGAYAGRYYEIWIQHRTAYGGHLNFWKYAIWVHRTTGGWETDPILATTLLSQATVGTSYTPSFNYASPWTSVTCTLPNDPSGLASWALFGFNEDTQ